MTRRTWSRDKLDVIERLLAQGRSRADIAREMGTTAVMVRWVIWKYKLNAPEASGKLKEAKETTLTARLMFLQGLSAKPEIEAREFSDEELLAWTKGLDGVGLFLKELLDEDLMDFQLEMTRKAMDSKFCVFNIGRGAGKDHWASLYLLYCAVVRPCKILIVSQGQAQSDELMGKIHAQILKSDRLYHAVAKSTMQELVFKDNGSRIISLPSTGFIRGHQNVDLCLVNECAHVPNSREIVEGVLMPMLAGARSGKLVLMSTPLTCSPDNAFWTAWTNPLFARVQAPTSASKYRSSEYLEEMKRMMPAERFRREFLAEFVSTENVFFDSQSIDRNVRDYSLNQLREDGKTYGFGWDPARARDASVLCVVSKDDAGMLRVEYVKEFMNVPFAEQESTIRYLHALFRPANFVAEYCGLGMASIESLGRDLKVERFVPTAESKLKMFDSLKLKLEQDALTLPVHEKMLTELKFFEFRTSPSGRTLLHHPAGGNDDHADALAMAVKALDRPPMIFDIEPLGYGPVDDMAELEKQEAARRQRWAERLKPAYKR